MTVLSSALRRVSGDSPVPPHTSSYNSSYYSPYFSAPFQATIFSWSMPKKNSKFPKESKTTNTAPPPLTSIPYLFFFNRLRHKHFRADPCVRILETCITFRVGMESKFLFLVLLSFDIKSPLPFVINLNTYQDFNQSTRPSFR